MIVPCTHLIPKPKDFQERERKGIANGLQRRSANPR
jgi:hypothetical protein